MGKQLFRKQAIEQQTNRLHGDVLLLPELSHVFILGFLLVWVVLLVAWMVNSSYSRKETVVGWLEPTSGVINAYAESPGIVKKILVQEGDTVTEGQALIIINGDRILEDGRNLEENLLSEYQSQKRLLESQLKSTKSIYQLRDSDLSQQLEAGNTDFELIKDQIETVTEQHEMILARVKKHKSLFKKGYLSSNSRDQIVEEELAVRNRLQSLERSKIKQISNIQQLNSRKILLPEEGSKLISNLRSKLSDLALKIAQLHGKSAHIVKATKPGVVDSLRVKEGQLVDNSKPLVSLVPENSKLIAKLLVPVSAIGFVETNQWITVRYDAFPYQKFGLYKGKINSVSSSILLPYELVGSPISFRDPVYRAEASLEKEYVEAYGKKLILKSGMTISADIVLAERSLLEWLLEPVVSLKGRL